jgi:hypothetical protein
VLAAADIIKDFKRQNMILILFKTKRRDSVAVSSLSAKYIPSDNGTYILGLTAQPFP